MTKVLEGITPIGFDKTSVIPYVGVLRGVIEFLDRSDSGISNCWWLSMTGAAYMLFWDWCSFGDNPLVAGEISLKRIFDTFGYDYEYVLDPSHDGVPPTYSKDFYKAKIVDSIDKGLPVITIGVMDPPHPSIVSGYDRGGDVLYARSYFNDHRFNPDENTGYLQTDDWYERCYGLILIKGRRHQRLNDKELLREALGLAVRFMTTSTYELRGVRYYSGAVCYDRMEEVLLDDSIWDSKDTDMLNRGMGSLGPCGLELMCCMRNEACNFLRDPAWEGLPGHENLLKAIDHFEGRWAVWDCIHLGLDRLRDRKVREEFAKAVLSVKVCEEKAAECLRRAYESLLD